MTNLPARVLAAIEDLDNIKQVFCDLAMYDHAWAEKRIQDLETAMALLADEAWEERCHA